MTTKKTKKITTKKNTAKKKTVAKKSVKPVVAAEAKKVAPVQAKKIEKEPKAKKMYEITPFFHGLIVFIVVLLYAELALFGVVYWNYDINLECKDTIWTRQMRAREKAKFNEVLRSKTPRRIRRVSNVNAKGQRRNVRTSVENKVLAKNNIEKTKNVEKPVFKCPEPVARKVSFVEEEYAPYAGEGNAIIEGSACFTLSNGSEKCFSNVDVFINPVTSYSDEWYNRAWAGREFLQKADERALDFNKIVKTDEKGAFKFSGLKPGSYYVGAAVCLPDSKDSKNCRVARFASKVSMKNRVKTILKKVYP